MERRGGYPAGLKGEAIPLGARILAVAYCLDAMISDRPYHHAVTIEEAMNRLAAEAGLSFDPKVVRVLQDRYIEIEMRLKAQTSDPSLRMDHNPVRDTLFPSENGSLAPLDAVGERGPAYLDTIAAARHEAQVLIELSQQLGNSLKLDETLALVCNGLRGWCRSIRWRSMFRLARN
ncbi:MAG: hypothetical protein FJW31_14750 [Acidobacteria bacterium]|nr:hypothetical protein [Acidobacteriota bacterium]